jgi:hypothetical protein
MPETVRDPDGEPNTFRRYMHMAFKKMSLVAGMALAAITFSAPASASALEWTDENASFGGEATDVLSGKLTFGNPAAGQIKFGCMVHLGIVAHGGTDTGTLESFNITTSTCEGEGVLTGCELKEDSVTGLPADIMPKTTYKVPITGELIVTGPIVVHRVFDDECPIEKTTWTVSEMTMTLTNCNLTDVMVSGLVEGHNTFRPSGMEVTQNFVVFGTMETATDTLSTS